MMLISRISGCRKEESRSLLSVICSISPSLWEQYKKHNQIEGLRYLPLLSYMLSRNVKNGDEDIRQWAERYKEADGEAIRHLRFVATYALNLNRGS